MPSPARTAEDLSPRIAIGAGRRAARLGVRRRTPWSALLVAVLAGAVSDAAWAQLSQDVVTVGNVSGAGTVDVPVFLRDVSGTPLGIDQPAGSRIQSYTLKVDYALAANVQSISFTRAGITASLTPTFESSPSAAGSITLIGTFQELTNLIPFTLNGAAPGNQVAHLLVTIPPAVPAGTVITLTLDPVLTQLTDQAGTPATRESVANGTLQLVAGSITVLASPVVLIPTLGTWALGLLAFAMGLVAVKMLRSPR